MIGKFRIWAWILAAQLTVSACAMDSNQTPRYFRGHSGGGIQYTGTDDLMKTDNPRIRRFREYYLRTVTVESALQNSRP
ncbi:MAG: hypothetical protein OEW12_05935, partial [Deltaproteobacteria bacterium]|nr:hypothetical protein [Deltaproteobacteria bacterium]